MPPRRHARRTAAGHLHPATTRRAAQPPLANGGENLRLHLLTRARASTCSTSVAGGQPDPRPRGPGRAGAVVGLDAAADVIATAQADADAAGDERATFTAGDVCALDLPGASFDVVHAHQVLQHLSDPVGALREPTPGGAS